MVDELSGQQNEEVQYIPSTYEVSEELQDWGSTYQTCQHDSYLYDEAPNQTMTGPSPHPPLPTVMAATPIVPTVHQLDVAKAVGRKQTRTTSAPRARRLSDEFKFEPIPGLNKGKRRRRRHDEIERKYKCGWEGCEKSYGTLNHLNGHVSWHHHGPKRTPDDFKELPKGRKSQKKEEHVKKPAPGEASRSKTDDDMNAPTTTAADAQPSVTASVSVGDELSPEPREIFHLAYEERPRTPANDVRKAPSEDLAPLMEFVDQYTYGGYAYTPQPGWVQQQEVVSRQQFGFGGYSTLPSSTWHPQQLGSGLQSGADAQGSRNTGTNCGVSFDGSEGTS